MSSDEHTYSVQQYESQNIDYNLRKELKNSKSLDRQNAR